MKRWHLAVAAMAMSLTLGATSAGAQGKSAIDTIKQRGKLKCGVTDSNAPGIAFLNDKGKWAGFDVDYCRALAVAILGNPEAVEFVPQPFAQWTPSLKSGELDVVARAVTYSIQRDTELGFKFVGPTLFSGHGFMVHQRTGVKESKGLNGASICILAGGITESLIADYFRARNMTFKPVAVDNTNQMFQLYESGRCDVVTLEPPFLAIRRMRLKNPAEHVILSELFAKSHMGPLTRGNDDPFVNVARWTHYGLVTAEELGVTQANVEQMLNSKDPQIRRFLGVEGNIGSKMGLTDDWMARVIKAVGNYGDIWERNFGKASGLDLPRGINALERDGGLQWAPNWR
jgi:general L-amino acid transport system substrate-binding protein